MARLRVLVVDDEPIARQGLVSLLGREPDLEIVGESKDGASAVADIRRLTPDLVLLDVQMPELDGFGVVRSLTSEEMPGVVFVTAYDRYAIDAFEVHAVDYVLKPVSEARFRTAIARARSRLQSEHQGELASRLERLLAERDASGGVLDRILVRSGVRSYFVQVADVEWIEAAGNYARLRTATGQHPIRETMKLLEDQLPRRFVRVHRSAIVNLDRIKELRALPSGDATVVLQSGATLTLSRGYRAQFEKQVGRGR
ncbi:MAG: response regulator [Gemmatimonadota bacterium]